MDARQQLFLFEVWFEAPNGRLGAACWLVRSVAQALGGKAGGRSHAARGSACCITFYRVNVKYYKNNSC